MIVLTIILSILGLYIIYEIVKRFDSSMNQRFGYKFFNKISYIIISVSYVLIYFGYKLYQSLLLSSGDTLNGTLLIIFGIIGLCVMIYVNILNTDISFGLMGSLFQFTIFSVLAVIGFIALVMVIMSFLSAEPVYNIND